MQATAQSMVLSVKTQVFPSTTVPVAESCRVIITASGNKRVEVSSVPLPASEDLLVEDVKFTKPQEVENGKWETKISVQFLPLAVGNFLFPSLRVPVRAEDPAAFFQAPPVKFRVVDALGENASADLLKDIKGPVKVAKVWIYGLVGFLLLLGAVLFWFYRLRGPSKKEEIRQIKPRRPAHEVALEKLEAALEEFAKKGDTKVFYSDLSYLFREYLSGRYDFDAMEKTTSEIFAAMRSMGIERKLGLQTREILESCDLVKFAKFIPPKKDLEADVDRAKKFIESTMPRPNFPPHQNGSGEKASSFSSGAAR